jgi:hypothetical protein
VKKKSRAYSNGVDRTIPNDEAGTLAVQELSQILNVTQQFKKGDEYINLSRNAAMFVHPLKVDQQVGYEGELRGIYTLCVRTLHPHLYDVIPDAQNPEWARCVVLSEYPAGNPYALDGAMQWDGSTRTGYAYPPQSDGVDQRIADSPADQGAGKRQYIFWTAKYHLTCDCHGKIIPEKTPYGALNPIQKLPFVNLAKDQDGSFWGQGGEDIVDGSILVNVFLTDAAAILNMQGWGQPVMKGKNLKGEYNVGPQNVLELSYEDGEQEPKYEIISTDPHTDLWLRILEVYIAMLLTTNNLSPRNIQGKLGDAGSIASGIAKLVDESESTDDITESQEYFIQREKEFWGITSRWLGAFRNAESLIPQLDTLPEFEGDDVNVKFKSQGVVLSEKEKLEVLQMRKKLGINTMIELLKKDDPSLTDEEAEKKLASIAKDQLIRMANEEADKEVEGKPDEEEPDEE